MILGGELEPGEQLPSGDELAKFFGVTRVTIGNAIRTLREEGFVRTKTGSGVYVRDQASLAAPGESDHPLADIAAAFLFGWVTSSASRGPGGCYSVSRSPRPSPSACRLWRMGGADPRRSHNPRLAALLDICHVARPARAQQHMTSALPVLWAVKNASAP